MRGTRPALMAVLAALFASPAIADDEFPNALAERENAVKLEPSSPWNIDFGESRCRLARIFGDEDARHLLFIEQGAPRARFTLTLSGPEIKTFHRSQDIWLGMERDEPMVQEERIGRAEVASYGEALIFTGFSINGEGAGDDEAEENVSTNPIMAGIDPTEASAVDRVVVKRGKRVVSFETGNMKAAIEALNTCTSELLIRWGLEPEEHAAYVPPRWLNTKVVVKRIQRDYPSKALRKGEQAIFRMRVIVEKDGTVSDCYIENATITKSLESSACREMRQAEFEPARSAEGTPIRSFYASTISYRIN